MYSVDETWEHYLSNINELQKDKYYMSLLTWGTEISQNHRDRK